MKVAVLLVFWCLCSDCQGSGDVVITIVTPDSPWHTQQAVRKQEQWSKHGATVILSTQLSTEGAPWTLTPLLAPLAEGYGSALWFVLVTEWTLVNVDQLDTALSTYDPHKEWYIGHSVEDSEPVIVHHFNTPHSLAFPLLHSGIILSAPALKRMATLSGSFNPSFNIDPVFEFSLFLKYLHTPVYKELHPSPSPPHPDGLLLTHLPALCTTPLTPHCATGVSLQQNCSGRLNVESVFFAVKTCGKFHKTRLPVVWDTWAAGLPESCIGYYSDFADERFKTTSLGIPNTEKGHCGKMAAILQLFEREQMTHDWLVVADDDTLLSVDRLLEVLRCYDSSRPVLMGDLYGYTAHRVGGSSFVSGGGSMVLSSVAVRSFVSTGQRCPTRDYADDMLLGMAAKSLGWDVVQSPFFHQDQPRSYPQAVIEAQKAVSFHRHSPMDPATVYSQYLSTEHETLRDKKTEL
ncbi:beta-1,3-glucosyltransferase-like [Halichondria panicea]|uniref:beta-1,3-glucosyltransferase-like n=1 Tax=Halichondria panicea TaxID=6063 RepID=UPI00312B3B88